MLSLLTRAKVLFVLSTFISLTGISQCPTVVTPSVTYNSGGQLTVKPVFNVMPSFGRITCWGGGLPTVYSASMTNTITFTGVSAGTHSVCIKADSLNSGCASVTGCIQVVAPAVTCPTVVTPSVTYNSGGQLTIQPVFDVTPASGKITSWVGGGATLYTTSMTNPITFTGVAAGTRSVCVKADSLNGVCASVIGCIQVVIPAAVVCPTVITPSVTYNSGGQLTIQPVFDVTPSFGKMTSWVSGGSGYYTSSTTSMTNPINYTGVAAGNYSVCVKADSLNSGCASVIGCVQIVVSAPSCQASFTYSTDPNCITHFVNTSTGSSLAYVWEISGVTYTTTNVDVSLANGNHNAQLITNAMIGPSMFVSCDTANQVANIVCPTNCTVNASFSVSPDSVHTGNYFVYDHSTGVGSLSYLWNFGDGTTSTQQYPVHQYATPGQYVLCLTVTAANGTVSCSDSYCDSSSVRRVASGFLMDKITVLPGTPTFINEKSAVENFKAYPNPVTESLTLDFGSLDQPLTYTFCDAFGRIVFEGRITEPKSTIDTSLLPNGFYMLNISTAEGRGLKYVKIVK